MAKRFQSLNEFGRTTKKPKLDISIKKGRDISNHIQKRSVTDRLQPTRSSTITTRSPIKSSPLSKNLWDDDDDDVILLAAADSDMKASNTPANELTFSEFAPNLHAATSTQHPTPPPPPPATVLSNIMPTQAPYRDIFSQIFGDDDDDFVLVADAAVSTKESSTKRQEVLRKPEPLAEHENQDLPSCHGAVAMTSSQSTMRRQLATERQIHFLMERVNALKNENSKLSKDLEESKSKIENKSGEASLLRDELRHIKQQVQQLKIEKISSYEAAKATYQSEINQLSKKVETKDTELRLKSVECSVLKMRHVGEMSRLEMSQQERDVSMCVNGEVSKQLKSRRSVQIKGCLKRLRGLNINMPILSDSDCFDLKEKVSVTSLFKCNSQLVYEPSHERGTTKMQCTIFYTELRHLQTIVAQLQLQQQKMQSLSTAEGQTYVQRTLKSVSKVFSEFWSYVHSLEFLKSCKVHPYHDDRNLQLNTFRGKHKTLLQPNELYEEERALNLRRYVATLSVCCQLLKPLTHAMLSQQHGDFMLMQIASDAIGKLSYARELIEHFGLLEAFAVLVRSMLKNVTKSEVEHLELLVGVLKQLVFARPNARIFSEISYCMLQCVKLPPALSLFCVNSGTTAFNSNHLKSLYRYSNDSCILQVYSGLLEICFPPSKSLSFEQFQLLTLICENHVRFIYACFTKPPAFIHHQLPCYDKEDEDDENEFESKIDTTETPSPSNNSDSCGKVRDNDNSFSSASTTMATILPVSAQQLPYTCECYTKLCVGVVTLLFQLMQQWIHSRKQWRTLHVAAVSKMSVQLLYIVFCDNYLTNLFRDSEETTKHHLSLLCKWWTECAEVLRFNQVQMSFLKKLQNSHVMPKRIADEEHIANISADFAEWCRLTNEIMSPKNDNLRNLRLIENATNADKFFEGLMGYSFNFQ